ncbi:TLD domain-containing protein [Ditylenchus destructor]|uniref:TLD domain-containing protein n=1 Tax=Ditylenchus destructor TaxID=166010 RepID=A0AAD4NJ91_9BILA|nr:TLD domain-containing protein [Ditylenchus destructor]
MGNSSSAGSSSQSPKNASSPPPPNPRIVEAFNRLSGGEENISFENFQNVFGIQLSACMWKHFQGNCAESTSLSRYNFFKGAEVLLHGSSDAYLRIILPAESVLACCFEARKISVRESDKQFLDSLKKDMTAKDDTFESVAQWKNTVCPRICCPVETKILDILLHRSRSADEISSDILSPAQLLILSLCLPTTVYFPHNEANTTDERNLNTQWTKLYSSASQGISINRFEHNCFSYKGATIAIFKLTNNQVFAIATDQEWRHSIKKFGGPHSLLFQLHPSFERIDVESPAIYCNLKNRSAGALGLRYGNVLSIDGDMSNVGDMEVWGCGGKGTFEEQQKQKLWLKQQAEKNSKVPLPGNWEGNPDKQLLEMAGFQFSNERKFDRPDDSMK